MKIQLLILTAAAMLFSLTTQAQSAFQTSSGLNLQTSTTPARAEWKVTEHDFGTIAQGKEVSFTFEVKNTGQQPLKIENVKPSCGCTVANYTKEAIAPGDKGVVTATFNGQAMGAFNKGLTVTTNVEDEPNIFLRIKGEVK